MANRKLESDDVRREHRLESYKKNNKNTKTYAFGYRLNIKEDVKIMDALEKAISENGTSSNTFFKNIIFHWLKENGYLE